VVTLITVLGLLGLAFWAGRESLSPPSAPDAEVASSTLRVEQGEVGRTTRVSVSAERDAGREIRVARQGTVTAVEERSSIQEGDVLLETNLRPTIVAVGLVPSFRDLKLSDQGPDVAQIQEFLVREGATIGVTQRYDDATVQAVKDWQGRVGVEQSGVVAQADVVFIASLPQRLEVMVGVGDQVDSSTVIARTVSDELNFETTLPNDPSVAVGARVTVELPTGSWNASVTGLAPADPNALLLSIGAAADDQPCGAPCADLDGAGPYTLPGSLVIVPPTVGPVVPVGAITSDSVGRQSVTMADGEVRGIVVKVAYGGLAVIEGVSVGEEILLRDLP